MQDEWSKAAKELTDSEREIALKNLLDSADEAEAGIIRQLLGKDGKKLTEKQQYVYDSHIEPSLVEKCGMSGCSKFVPAGTGYCGVCSVKYGD